MKAVPVGVKPRRPHWTDVAGMLAASVVALGLEILDPPLLVGVIVPPLLRSLLRPLQGTSIVWQHAAPGRIRIAVDTCPPGPTRPQRATRSNDRRRAVADCSATPMDRRC